MSFRKRKELIDLELDFYKKEKLFEINSEIKHLDLTRQTKLFEVDKEIEAYRNKRQKELTDIAKKCYEELGQHEHNYHSSLEKRGIEVAKLEAKKEDLEEIIEVKDKLLQTKDEEIKRLNELLVLLIKQPHPSTTIQQLK